MVRRGIVRCNNCGWYQPWIASNNWSGPRAASYCRKCGRRNRFRPAIYLPNGQRVAGLESRGRKNAVDFYGRPNHDPRRALIAEAKARNLRSRVGVIVDEDELVVQETLSFADRVQERIDSLRDLVESSSNPGNQE